MKKILTIALAIIMVMILSVSVYATQVDLTSIYGNDIADATVATSEELVGINFPEGITYNTGDVVTVHFVGNSDGDFRVWLAHAEGFVTMTPEPIWKASENGFTSGAFDFTIDLVVGDKDGKGETVADSIIFKAPSAGGNLSNFSLSLVEIVDGKDDAPTEPETAANEGETETASASEAEAEVTEPETAPETNDTPAVPETGIVLAVVPAVIALAAVAVTKKR